jgi:NADP-dependent 3-hydroxy acid dehydrogenase YdfG
MSSHVEVQKAAKVLADQHNLEVDILINAAGTGPQFDWLSENDENIDKMVDTNFKSCLWLTRAFLPGFIQRRSGHIVTVSSTCAVNPTPRKFIFIY